MNVEVLIEAIDSLLTVRTLSMLFIGTVVGTLTGVLPGIGPVGSMAIVMPFSFTLDPIAGILMLLGIFLGARYGGTTTAILMRVPGEQATIVLIEDGYALTRRGRGGGALAISAIGSTIAVVIGIGALALIGPGLSDAALRLSAPEFLVIAVLALIVLSRVLSTNFGLALAIVGLGLALNTVGLDPVNGVPRLTFGYSPLQAGLQIAPLAAGLFGVGEILSSVGGGGSSVPVVKTVKFRELVPTRDELRLSMGPAFRGGVLGFLIGIFPGPSDMLSAFSSYRLEHRLASPERRREFGRGAIEVIAGPGSADNGASIGHLVPLLVLGLPFSAGTAILLGAMMQHQVTPGPLFATQQPEFFATIILGLLLASFLLLMLNLPLVGLFVQVLRIPRDLLFTGILIAVMIGAYAIRNSMLDVYTLIAAGVIGHLMKKFDLPRAPLVLGFVLGPFIERSLTRTLALSRGDPTYILGREVAVTIFVVTVIGMLAPPLVRAVRDRRARRPSAHNSPRA